jgi:arylsulfatase
VTFTNAFGASFHNRESVSAMLSGYLPTEAIDGSFGLDATTIASTLSEAGRYATGGFHSIPYVSRALGFDSLPFRQKIREPFLI